VLRGRNSSICEIDTEVSLQEATEEMQGVFCVRARSREKDTGYWRR